MLLSVSERRTIVLGEEAPPARIQGPSLVQSGKKYPTFSLHLSPICWCLPLAKPNLEPAGQGNQEDEVQRGNRVPWSVEQDREGAGWAAMGDPLAQRISFQIHPGLTASPAPHCSSRGPCLDRGSPHSWPPSWMWNGETLGSHAGRPA